MSLTRRDAERDSGTHDHIGLDDQPLAVPEDELRVADVEAAARPMSSSRRRADYRLRGLDLSSAELEGEHDRSARRRQPQWRYRRRRLLACAVIVAVAVAVAMFVRTSLIVPYTVPSAAMAPTLQAGDRIVVLRDGSFSSSIHRGDIIVFRSSGFVGCRASGSSDQDLVKRVIGLPGDRIRAVGDTVYVDGQRYAAPGARLEPAAASSSARTLVTTVPADHYFVLGDNPGDSCDSRTFGAIPTSAVVGKVVAIVARGGHLHLHLF